MNRFSSSRIVLTGLVSFAVACGSQAPEGRLGERTASQKQAFVATHGDQPLTVKVEVYHRNAAGEKVYALRIGDNLHPVSGCELEEVNAAIEQPFNNPREVVDVAQEGGEMRARLSCRDDDAGDLPLESTEFYLDAAGRFYMPSGSPGEYYSFLDGDPCLAPLKSKLFKLDHRMSEAGYLLVEGAPPDLQKDIKLSCGSTADEPPYRLYKGTDYSLPGVSEQDPDDWDAQEAFAQYVVLEAKDNGKSVLLPIHRINGAPLDRANLGALQAWLGIPVGAEIPGVYSALPDFDANHEFVRSFDFCLDPVTPESCTFQHYRFPALTTDFPEGVVTLGSRLPYQQKLNLDGSTYEEIPGDAVRPPERGAPVLAFTDCAGMLEGNLGLPRPTAPRDSRKWVTDQANNLLRPTPPGPRFRCPAPRTSNVCPLVLGGAEGPDGTETMPLGTLNDRISEAARACSGSKLAITLNSNVTVSLAPWAGVSFDRFPDVTIAAAPGTRKKLVFRERCDDVNSCLPGNFPRTRTVIGLSRSVPTRSLRVERVLVDYDAENATTPPPGNGPPPPFFDLPVILIRAEGTATDRRRIVFVDAKVGSDTTSQRFVRQTLKASFGDVFAVRSVLGGTDDATTQWKSVGVTNSLVVLAGSPTSPSEVRGAGGGLGINEGRNDLLAVNALVQGPILSNAVSRSVLHDSVLLRSPGKYAIHFAGTGTTDPPSLNQMSIQGASSIVQMQHGSAVPLVVFETTVEPKVSISRTVQYFSGNLGESPIPLTDLGRTYFCEGRGQLRFWNDLGLPVCRVRP